MNSSDLIALVCVIITLLGMALGGVLAILISRLLDQIDELTKHVYGLETRLTVIERPSADRP